MAFQLLNGHNENDVYSTEISHNDHYITGDTQGKLCLWSAEGTLLSSVTMDQPGPIASICCSKLQPNVFYAAANEHVQIFDMRNMDAGPQFTQLKDMAEINQVILNEKETLLACCDDAGVIKIQDLRSNALYPVMKRHTNICSSIAFRPQRNNELYSGGLDSHLLQWDISEHRCRQKNIFLMTDLDYRSEQMLVVANPPLIHSIAVSHNGHLLAAGLENAFVRLFNGKHKHLQVLPVSLGSHNQPVSQVSFAPYDDKILLTAGNDGRVNIYDMSPLMDAVDQSNDGASLHTDSTRNLVTQPLMVIVHTSSINWFASGAILGCRKIILADNTPSPSIYTYPL